MPIYEYQCQKCGKKFEYMQSFRDPKKTVCEECGGELDRLISATAFHLKGTGWYKTDYASPSSSTPSSGGGSEKKTDGGDSKTDASAKTDTPAAAAPAATGGSSEKSSASAPDKKSDS